MNILDANPNKRGLRHPDAYGELASHLDMDDPEEGARRIDFEILRFERAMAFPRNLTRLALLTSGLTIALGLAMLFLPLALGDELKRTALFWLGQPLWTSAVLGSLGSASAWFAFADFGGRPGSEQFFAPRLPTALQKWLTDNGHTSGLRYWSALYWPRAKLCGYRREWFGFTFWRRAPRLHRRDCAFAGIIDLE